MRHAAIGGEDDGDLGEECRTLVVGVPFAGLEGEPVGAAGHRGAGGEQGRDAALGIGAVFAERGPLVAVRGCGEAGGQVWQTDTV